MSIGHELLDVPFGEMVVQLATAIAEGQYKMDLVSCKIASMMGSTKQCAIEIPNFETDEESASGEKSTTGTEKVSLIGAGFQPTFYQFTDTIIEVKISIKITKSTEATVSGKFGCSVASVSASFAAKYSYSAEGSSLIRTKITPVPPSSFLQTLLDLKAQMEQKRFEKTYELIEKKIAAEEKKADEAKGDGKGSPGDGKGGAGEGKGGPGDKK